MIEEIMVEIEEVNIIIMEDMKTIMKMNQDRELQVDQIQCKIHIEIEIEAMNVIEEIRDNEKKIGTEDREEIRSIHIRFVETINHDTNVLGNIYNVESIISC